MTTKKNAHAKPAAEKKAHGVEPRIKDANLKRLVRIEGQVRGIRKMVEDDRYCPDILAQVSAAEQALRAVSIELLRNHLTHCAANALNGSEVEAAAAREELLKIVSRFAG
jgi:DNA-binding FrmR family transcriptional regulator